uniref:Uncharacterized protein n=1 Tax=Megaselia scalaris TaxID=36166 RepID=T1GK44_MEGSC
MYIYEGVIVSKNDFHASKHPEWGQISNLQEIKELQNNRLKKSVIYMQKIHFTISVTHWNPNDMDN